MIKTEKIKEKMKNVWEIEQKPVPIELLNDLVDYAIEHENMEMDSFQNHVKTKLERENPEGNE